MSTARLRFLKPGHVMRLYDTHVFAARLTQQTYLESATYSPKQHNRYGEKYMYKLAAILAQKIILNHAYQDGNKRAALLAADMFLKINGHKLQGVPFTGDELDRQLMTAHLAVASNQWDAERLASFYESVAAPLTRVTPEIQE